MSPEKPKKADGDVLNNERTISDSERMENYIKHRAHEKKRKIESNKPLINAFKALCKTKGLILTDDDFDYIPRIGIVAKHTDILLVLSGQLSRDKERLVACKDIYSLFRKKNFSSGYLYHEKFIAMANPCFRRGMHQSNHYAPRFMELFWAMDDKGIDSYLSLDYDRVRIDVDGPIYIEQDIWYGPRFNQDISLILDGVSKLKPSVEFKEFTEFNEIFFADIYSMNVKWEKKGRIKTFQSEEFKTRKIQIERKGELVYPARYVHADYNMDIKAFQHFDGAVHYYTEEDYFARRDSDFNYNIKEQRKIKPPSEKLFKLTGNIKVDVWVEFCSHFFTGNPLMFEYFSGSYPKHISSILEKIRENARGVRVKSDFFRGHNTDFFGLIPVTHDLT